MNKEQCINVQLKLLHLKDRWNIDDFKKYDLLMQELKKIKASAL
jgi:hypothetical protein